MRILMMAVLLLAAMPVVAQNWVEVGEDSLATYHIDPGSIRVNGHLRRVWILQDLKQRNHDGYMSRRIFLEYDCKEERSRILSFLEHSEPMAGGRPLFSSSISGQWDYTPPGTADEGMLKFACAVKPAPAAPVPQRPQPLSPSDPLFRPL